MPSKNTVESLTAQIAEIEEQRSALKAQQRDLVLALANKQDEEQRAAVRAYWDERIKTEPDHPDVLRARAAMLDADNAESNVVQAATAIVEAEGNN
jgi:isochorismate hydrolase